MSQSSPKSVVVVGAGLAGLSAAYELQKSGFKVSVLEEKHLPGGRMAEEKVGSFMNITGASGLNSWYSEMFDLCDELGHGDSLEKLPGFGTGTATDGNVQFPMSNAPSRYELLTSPVLSLRSKLRLASLLPDINRARRLVDPCLIHTAADFDDESLAEYLTRKVGTDFLEYVVAPLFNVALAYNVEQLSKAIFLAQVARNQSRRISRSSPLPATAYRRSLRTRPDGSGGFSNPACSIASLAWSRTYWQTMSRRSTGYISHGIPKLR